MIDFDDWASGLDERIERDIDYIRDEEEQQQVITGYANPDGSGKGNWLFCAVCGYVIDAHWHTDDQGMNEWYACPSETETRARWGNK